MSLVVLSSSIVFLLFDAFVCLQSLLGRWFAAMSILISQVLFFASCVIFYNAVCLSVSSCFFCSPDLSSGSQMTLFKAELEEYRTAWKNNLNLESDTEQVCPLISSVSLNS